MENKDYLDYLTGIRNRMGLFHLFDELEADLVVGVMFFDLDNFKTVNDMYGHDKGDETLINFANIMTNRLPEGAVAARLGGDEFAALIIGEKSKEFCIRIAENILDDMRLRKASDASFEIVSASIGIVHNYLVKDGLDGAINSADKAMYLAKEQGKGKYVVYDDYEERINYEKRIEEDATKAMTQGRIIVKYHPVLQIQSSRMICTEACCLWQTPEGGILGRNDFRSILLKTDFINELDIHVFELVCRDYHKYSLFLKPDHKIGVQFSHLFLLDENRIGQLSAIMNRYGVDPTNFEINLDESVFSSRINQNQLVSCIKKLHEKGFSISLSHFGEDFSSVRYLKELPISKLKLDGGFISENIKDQEGIRVLKSIVKLGKGYKSLVVGCIADDDKTMTTLSECGCDAATGEFFSKKLSLDEYIEYVKRISEEDSDTIVYRFCGDFAANKRFEPARIVGEDIKLTEGISEKWGAVNFPGGPSQTNYIKLPAELFNNDSYTISMWIKPMELQNWVSAMYVRFQSGFMSFMPNIAGGRCMLRILEDTGMENWHDTMTGALVVGKWTYVTCSYDARSSIARIYINGELEAESTKVPGLSNPTEFWIGSDVFQMSFCGLVSGVSINAGALESEEIRQRYEAFLSEPKFAGNESESEVMLSEIEVHDPAIFEDPVSKRFYIYGTTGEGYTSTDLMHWKYIGIVADKVPKESLEWTDSDAIWAPDIVKVDDEYRLYCSNSSFGVSKSAIFLAVADNPSGPFKPKGIVVKTDNDSNVNAIDANIIEDVNTHRQYMVYGSFWSGIHIVELSKETGFIKEGEGFGKIIARRPAWNDNAIEGPYIIYHPETRYYYLFVSYGSLTCDYNIRVGRSKNITGPYLDYNGRDMVDTEDINCTTGLMISCGYRYLQGQAYMGPGHNSVLLRDNGDMFLVSHIRKMAFNRHPGPGLLQIRKMIMTPDGWPIALGQPYNAETLLAVRDELLIGNYERIELRPSVPQGISHAHPMKLFEGGRLEMASVIGTWERVDEFSLKLKYGPVTEFVHFEKGLDKEQNRTTVVMGGLTSQGICTWAKKEELKYQKQ